MKQMNNCNSNCNADNQFINAKKEHKKDRGISVSIDPSAASWDSTPNTCEEMINTYGTYEIQATADTENQYPAIAQGYNKGIKRRDCENRVTRVEPVTPDK